MKKKKKIPKKANSKEQKITGRRPKNKVYKKITLQENRKKESQEIQPLWKLKSQKYDLTKKQEEGLTGR